MQARDDPATELSFYGFIEDHHDALLLITAARLGLVPRFRRRLNLAEQDALIYSGSVFLWTEEESCMKRWTDGYPWSPSRIHHQFLLYREMIERGCARSRTSSRLVANDTDDEKMRSHDSGRRKAIRLLAGSLFNSKELENLVSLSISGDTRMDDAFRRGGLMKKTFSLALPGETWHVVSYYTLEDVLASRLPMLKESFCFKGLNIAEDVQRHYAASLTRQSRNTSTQGVTETSSALPLSSSSSQVTVPCDTSPKILAEPSRRADSVGLLDMFSIPVENFAPCLLPSPPLAYATPHSAENRRQNSREDLTTEWYYAFT